MTVPRVLFVCLGNICRSPLAEGIFVRDAAREGIDVYAKSAGIGDWHVGQLADPRSRQVGEAIGCRMDMRARQFRSRDFVEFDLIVAMDRSNLRDLKRWPGADWSRLKLAMTYDRTTPQLDVPDPYYGEIEAFEEAARLLERVSKEILSSLTPSPTRLGRVGTRPFAHRLA